MKSYKTLRVLQVGVGGVGGWCAEALIRSGAGRLTLVDMDRVEASNVNRQLPATSQTLGLSKAEVMAARLREINPAADIDYRVERFTESTSSGFHMEDYDVVVDAIDSVGDKAALLRCAAAAGCRVVSSMGAARRMDPTGVRTGDFWSVQGDPLAKALRKRLRRVDGKSGKDEPLHFPCVYSIEVPSEAVGTMVTVTAAFGMALAALALENL